MKTTIQKTFASLLLVMLLVIGTVTPAHAQEIYQGDTVPAGVTLDQDVILFGQDVTIDGTVNGNVFILGNEVQVNGTVDGSLILIGQNAAISGSVSGTVYAAALTLDLAPNSVLARDLYAVTVSLTSGKDSLIGRDLYAIFARGEIILTTATTAEMVKLMENTYRDVNIAIAMEFSRLADRFGVDIWEAISLANRHPRVRILNPGPGVGGHCISVDPWFLVEAAPDLTPLINTARKVNDSQPAFGSDLERGQVIGMNQSDDFGEIEMLKTKLQRGSGGFGSITFAPKRLVEQVAHFSFVGLG